MSVQKTRLVKLGVLAGSICCCALLFCATRGQETRPAQTARSDEALAKYFTDLLFSIPDEIDYQRTVFGQETVLKQLDGNSFAARRILDLLKTGSVPLSRQSEESSAWSDSRQQAELSARARLRALAALAYIGPGVAPYANELLPYLSTDGPVEKAEKVGDFEFLQGFDPERKIIPETLPKAETEWFPEAFLAAVALVRCESATPETLAVFHKLINDRELVAELDTRWQTAPMLPDTPLDFQDLTLRDVLIFGLSRFEPDAKEVTEYTRNSLVQTQITNGRMLSYLFENSDQAAATGLPLLLDWYVKVKTDAVHDLIAAACRNPENFNTAWAKIESFKDAKTKVLSSREQALQRKILIQYESRNNYRAGEIGAVVELLNRGRVGNDDVIFATARVTADIINQEHPQAKDALRGVHNDLRSLQPGRVKFSTAVLNMIRDPFTQGMDDLIAVVNSSQLQKNPEIQNRAVLILARMGPAAEAVLPALHKRLMAANRNQATPQDLYAMYRIGKDDPRTLEAARRVVAEEFNKPVRAVATFLLAGQVPNLALLTPREWARINDEEILFTLQRVAARLAGDLSNPDEELLETEMFEFIVDTLDVHITDPRVQWERIVRDCGNNADRAAVLLGNWLGSEPDYNTQTGLNAFDLLDDGATTNQTAFLTYLRMRSVNMAWLGSANLTRLTKSSGFGAESIGEFSATGLRECPTIDTLPLSAEMVPVLIRRAEEILASVPQLERQMDEDRGDLSSRPRFGRERYYELRPASPQLTLAGAGIELASICVYLARLGPAAEAAIPTLVKIAELPPLTATAAVSLRALGPASDSSLSQAYAKSEEHSWTRQMLTAWGYGESKPATDQVVEDSDEGDDELLQRVSGPSARRAEQAVKVLAARGKTSLDQLAGLADNAPIARRTLIVSGMKDGGSAAARHLLKYAADAGQPEEVRQAAIQGLQGIEDLPQDIAADLGALLQDKDESIALLAAYLLDRLGPNAAPAAADIVRMLQATPQDELLQAIVDDHRIFSGQFGNRGAQHTLDQYDDRRIGDGELARLRMFRLLRQAGPRARMALPFLVDIAIALRNPPKGQPEEYLGLRGERPGEFVPQASLATQELFAAIHNAQPDAATVVRLIPVVSDKNLGIFVQHALQGVTLDEDMQQAESALQASLKGANEEVRGYSALLAGGVRQPGEELRKALIDKLNDPSDFVIASAASAIGRLGVREALPQLKEALMRSPTSQAATTIADVITLLEANGGGD